MTIYEKNLNNYPITDLENSNEYVINYIYFDN